MIKYLTIIFLTISLLSSCKQEHPDLKTAFTMFQEAQSLKQSIMTNTADIKNQAQLVDGKIRNEDKDNVFTISEVYNHLEAVEKAMSSVSSLEKAVPGHEKESNGISTSDPKLEPALILMQQKTFRDTLLVIKSDLDAAATLLTQLKSKVN